MKAYAVLALEFTRTASLFGSLPANGSQIHYAVVLKQQSTLSPVQAAYLLSEIVYIYAKMSFKTTQTGIVNCRSILKEYRLS